VLTLKKIITIARAIGTAPGLPRCIRSAWRDPNEGYRPGSCTGGKSGVCFAPSHRVLERRHQKGQVPRDTLLYRAWFLFRAIILHVPALVQREIYMEHHGTDRVPISYISRTVSECLTPTRIGSDRIRMDYPYDAAVKMRFMTGTLWSYTGYG
jgi:hypothetical protein